MVVLCAVVVYEPCTKSPSTEANVCLQILVQMGQPWVVIDMVNLRRVIVVVAQLLRKRNRAPKHASVARIIAYA